MAGAAKTGVVVASKRVLARSSANPFAMRAKKFAEAGHIKIRSAQRARVMCCRGLSVSAVGKSSIKTGESERVCNVVGVINFDPPCVRTQRIFIPAVLRERRISGILHAAILPLTINKTE